MKSNLRSIELDGVIISYYIYNQWTKYWLCVTGEYYHKVHSSSSFDIDSYRKTRMLGGLTLHTNVIHHDHFGKAFDHMENRIKEGVIYQNDEPYGGGTIGPLTPEQAEKMGHAIVTIGRIARLRDDFRHSVKDHLSYKERCLQQKFPRYTFMLSNEAAGVLHQQIGTQSASGQQKAPSGPQGASGGQFSVSGYLKSQGFSDQDMEVTMSRDNQYIMARNRRTGRSISIPRNSSVDQIKSMLAQF